VLGGDGDDGNYRIRSSRIHWLREPPIDFIGGGDEQGGVVQQHEELRATAMAMNFISIGSSPKRTSIHEPPSKFVLIVLVETTLEWCIYERRTPFQFRARQLYQT
jgi:hypothetical protein